MENSSADYQTKQTICLMDCKTFERMLTLSILIKKRAKQILNSSADNQTK